MQIVEMKIGDIKPYEKNPRRNDNAVDKVANSIKEFGFKSPIIVDSDNVIIAGHTRHKAAQKLGLAVVPCVVAKDLTEAQVKAYRLADNKTAEFAEWDYGLLANELEQLQEMACNLDIVGFDGWELDNMLNPVTEDDLQEFFVDREEKPKELKKVHCPLCGGEFEQ